ncbi:MAG TPA: MFS transporter [Steroidobacteraceae bacterium]
MATTEPVAAPVSGKASPRYYGWYVALACGVGLGCGIASVLTSTFQVFLAPLQAEFGWTRPQLFLALTITLLVVTGLAPFFGALVDRVGARRLILIGLLLEAAVFASFSLQSASLPPLYLRYVALAALAMGTTHVGFARIITVWFDRQRGLALGIMLAGLGVGNAVWPVLTQWGIDRFGWRSAYLLIAGTIVVVGFGTVALVVRESPQSVGLPDASLAEPGATPSQRAQFGMSRREATRTSTYWLMLAAFLLIGVSVSSVQAHMIPLLRSHGVSASLAARVLSVLGIAVVLGRLAAGWLMDRFFAPRVAMVFLAGPTAATALLAAGVTGPWAFMAGLMTGLAVGAEMDVTTYLASRYFGVRHFSAIFAFFYAAYTLGAAFGPLGTAIAVDKTGGYAGPLAVHAVLMLVGVILLSRLPPFPRWT